MPSAVADYTVLETIGKGSFGTCRKVQSKKDGKVRAGGQSNPDRAGLSPSAVVFFFSVCCCYLCRRSPAAGVCVEGD
jgi:hypothetical protein